MRTTTRLASTALAVGLMAIYLAAKVHFVVRFGEIPLAAYLAEHWWFWAAAVLLAWLDRFYGRTTEQ